MIQPVKKRAKTKSNGAEKFQSSSISSTENEMLGGTLHRIVSLALAVVVFLGLGLQGGLNWAEVYPGNLL